MIQAPKLLQAVQAQLSIVESCLMKFCHGLPGSTQDMDT